MPPIRSMDKALDNKYLDGLSGKRMLLISANTYADPYPIYPLGISYLKTAVANRYPALRVDVADMNFTTIEQLADMIKANGYMAVGLSMRNIDNVNYQERNYFVEWYKKLAECIKRSTNAVFHGGGAGYSIFPQLLYRELGLDFGIKGEGEDALCRMIEVMLQYGIESGAQLQSLVNDGTIENKMSEIEGLVWCDGKGCIRVNGRVNYEKELDLSFEDECIDYYWEKSGMLNIQTKRGCPHHCIYCSYPIIEGAVVRTLSSERIVNVLKELYHRHKINYVFFTDSVFNMKRSYNYELCQRIIDSGIKISWGAYFSPNKYLTERDLELYKKSGLTHIEFGTESFSDTQLKNYGKEFCWAEVLEKSKICDSLGIFYSHFMILAGYGETEQSLQESYEHSRLLDNTVIFPYIGMRIYPGTKLAEYAMAEGIIKSEADMLKPCFYISKSVDLNKIKPNAKATGANWVFPDDPPQPLMERYRKKKIRGPLWEYLKFARFNSNNYGE